MTGPLIERPRAGKVTAVPHDQAVHLGASLVAVVHAHHAKVLQRMEWVVDQPWKRGFGAEDQRAVDEVRSLLGRIEKPRPDDP